MQVLGFFIEARKEKFPRHICNNILLQEAKTILEYAVQLQKKGCIPLWKKVYYSLVMIEKMLQQFPDLTFGKDLEVMLSAITVGHCYSRLLRSSSLIIAS